MEIENLKITLDKIKSSGEEVILPKVDVVTQMENSLNAPDTTPKVQATPNDIQLIQLSKFFGIANPTLSERSMMDYLYGFYDKAGIPDMNSLFTELSYLQQKLGTSSYGMSGLSTIYNHIKILSSIITDQTRMKNVSTTK